ncbi:MAG: hypothetical protein Q8R10_19670 [Pseudomonas sp.]|uniref:hypothetical protein n=1 Tax=Pseudomonas sp. TaxID=306 RepID=UPI002732545C|nr:hypothetical protein [Pseudomonas sp.]MDP3848644.1 hypothetical protein [Pseudomonas sp.]
MENSTDIKQQETQLFADSPETAMIYNPQVNPSSIDDVMLCALQRNAAVVDILVADIAEQDHFSVPIGAVRNLLWLLQGQFRQMETIMRDYRKPQLID